MSDITYCSKIDCRHETCYRHQKFAPKNSLLSIADLNDNCYLKPEVDDDMLVATIKRSIDAAREDLLAAVCRGTQKTNYKCDEVCKAMCGSDDYCAYCATIVDAIEEIIDA